MSDHVDAPPPRGADGALDEAHEGTAPVPPAEALFAGLRMLARAVLLDASLDHDQATLHVHRDSIAELLTSIRREMPAVVLVEVTALDYLDQDERERFAVVYVLQDRTSFLYFQIHAWVPEDDLHAPSSVHLWDLARWAERECHDMFGIVFDGNPDLRRLLMPEDYPGFPLRKDYPLKGCGERTQFPRLVPDGDEMRVAEPEQYPVTIGRGLHTPEYLQAMRTQTREELERQPGERKQSEGAGE